MQLLLNERHLMVILRRLILQTTEYRSAVLSTNSQRTGLPDCGVMATNISVVMTTDLQQNVIFVSSVDKQQC